VTERAVPVDPYESLKVRLDEFHVFPTVYTFKFVMKVELVEQFVPLLAGWKYSVRNSAAGRHVSITADLPMASSDDVIALYRRAATIEGVISL
jgi:putative lipoic acid-binding regulatory protein